MVIYHTVKNIGGKNTLANLVNYSISPSSFANFHNFHNIPYANGLQLVKVFSAKLPTVLIRQSFLPPKFFTVRYYIFYGFFCASECLSLTWSDITIAEDHVLVELRQSKTDPFRRGQSSHLFPINSSTCPVQALKLLASLVDIRPSHSLVFSTGAFSPLTRLKLTETIRCLFLQARRCPHNYSSHSFRIGTATTAAAVGLPT